MFNPYIYSGTKYACIYAHLYVYLSSARAEKYFDGVAVNCVG